MAVVSDAAAAAAVRERRRQTFVMVGLLLTFVGAFLVALLLPIGESAIDRELPVIAAGLLALWVGGLLMGRASGRRVP